MNYEYVKEKRYNLTPEIMITINTLEINTDLKNKLNTYLEAFETAKKTNVFSLNFTKISDEKETKELIAKVKTENNNSENKIKQRINDFIHWFFTTEYEESVV